MTLALHAVSAATFIATTNLLIRLPRLFDPDFGPVDLVRSTAAGVAVYGPYAMIAYAAIVAIGHALPGAAPSAPPAAPIEPAHQSPVAEPERESDALVLREGDARHAVAFDAIDWIEADDNYVLVAGGGRTHRARVKIGDIEARLRPDDFIRVHRSAIVPIRRVRSIARRAHGDWTVELESGREFPVARGRRRAVEEAFARIEGRPPGA
jgi:two-component system LytT family response regulator